ncbi:putative EamA domain-containing protein [Lupinus albus]|uniref:WAT1-related protein n=1 Tax=Lupinus albus TaxID=3870 RepID=A0A6A4PDE9_LUPAL|nr:putative EamA domain-containing protein [Lupinus albus]
MEGNGYFGRFLHSCKPYIAMICLQFGYAGMVIIAKVSLNHGMSHYVLVVYRYVFATLAIAPFALVLERKIRPKITFVMFIQMFMLGLLGPVIDQNLYYAGLKFTSPTYSCAISNMLPAMTFVMAVIFSGHNCGNNCSYFDCGRCGMNYFVIKTIFLNLMRPDAVQMWLRCGLMPPHHCDSESYRNCGVIRLRQSPQLQY